MRVMLGAAAVMAVWAGVAAAADPGCVAVGAVGATLTPPDLGEGVLACAAAQDWDRGVELYILMRFRAAYDAKRVADETAHQAGAVLAQQVIDALPPGGEEALQAAFGRFGETGSARHGAFCKAVLAAGPSSHDPAWMIAHGMRAFTDPGSEAMVPGFDPKAAWTALMRDYMHCG